MPTRVIKTIFFGMMLLAVYSLSAQNTPAPTHHAIGGIHGIWVVCGDALPKNFFYRISRQKGNGNWQKVAEVKTPASKEEIQASVLNTQRTAGIDIEPPNPERMQNLWLRITNNTSKNCPPEIENDIPLRVATGTAWYDAAVDSGAHYRYKIQMIAGKAGGPELLTDTVSYPKARFVTDIRPASVKPIATGITVRFQVVDKGSMTHCRILRGYYLRSGLQPVDVQPEFITLAKVTYITFTDNSAVPKVPYTYAVLPIDGAGNLGFVSPQAKVFDVPDKSIAPSVYNFRTRSDEADKAIRLSWTVPSPRDVISVDIYRSNKFDGKYLKIAGLPPTDTVYLDKDVSPIVNYFYSIRLNGYYEKSPASPKIGGILKASETNRFAPAATLNQDGSKITISWARTKAHTHAWYVYRADNGGNDMRQIAGPIISDSSKLHYTDVLPERANPSVYKYSIADENTSYVISPKSKPMFAYTGGLSTLPIPYDVAARKVNNHKVMILWPDLRAQSKNFVGYQLYRRTQNGVPQLVTERLIPLKVNMFTDSLTTPGEYYYSVRTVGQDGKTLSSPSLEAGFEVSIDLPLGVSGIKVLPSGKTVLLSWNNPMGQKIAGIELYRAVEGEAPTQIATLPADTQTYIDKDVAAGKVYYYVFTVKNSAGQNSPMTEPVGVHVD